MDVVWPNNIFGHHYCSSPHPEHPLSVYCRRPRNHEGVHSAYVFSIRAPESWPAAGQALTE